MTERVSLRTSPKTAGNFSLTLREWGLFYIESRLQGAGGVCYTYGMEESNTHYNKERRLTPMKKLARLTALLLTGALLLVLTACGTVAEPETEQQAKQRLLMEITSYRASIQLAPLVEVEQLSDAERIWVEQFRTADKTKLPRSKTEETYTKWKSMTEKRTRCSSFGWGMSQDASGELSDILFAKVPANTSESKAELLAELNFHSAFKNSNCTSIGIAVVTIDGQMYWTCSVYY